MSQNLDALERTRARIRSVKWKQIVLPFAVGVVGLLLLTALAGLAPRTSLSANLLLVLLILCPTFVLLFALVIGLTAVAYGLHRLNEQVEAPMRRLEALTLRASDATHAVTGNIRRQTVELSARAAPLEHWMNNAFEPKTRPMETRDGEE